jgi:hypothetical protein
VAQGPTRTSARGPDRGGLRRRGRGVG